MACRAALAVAVALLCASSACAHKHLKKRGHSDDDGGSECKTISEVLHGAEGFRLAAALNAANVTYLRWWVPHRRLLRQLRRAPWP